MNEKGIIYVATADRFIQEAEVSAQSAKKCMPDLPIVLFTHDKTYVNSVFDEICVVGDYENLNSDKINPILNTPFEKTLFIDTDTYFCESILDVFDLLDNYDLAVTHAYHRRPQKMPCPNCFPEVNGGVIFYRKTEQVLEFFKEWKRLYKELFNGPRKIKKDQPSLRQVLYESKISSYILPPEYNLRPQFPSIIGRGETMKIMHIRHPDLKSWVDRINENPHLLRVTIPTWEYFEAGGLVVMRGVLLSKFIKLSLKLIRLLRGHRLEKF